MRNNDRRPILIDTDAGVDDALALVYALRSPEVVVDTVTTVAGNVEVNKCTRNVHRILDVLRPDVPVIVAEGAFRPLKIPLTTAPEVHGSDGLGNISRVATPARISRRRGTSTAVQAILDACIRHGESLTIIAIGPLTNLALAWKANPRLLQRVGRIISMGGAFRVPGNTGPVAEFNYFVDPDAAEIILNAPLTIMIVPLDVTEQCILLREEFESAIRRCPSTQGRFLLRVTRDYMRYHEQTEGFRGGYLHDPLAVAAAIDPSLLTTLRTVVHVERRSPLTRGMTVAEFRLDRTKTQKGVEVAVAVERERFLRLFFERVI
jgi:inosine-uridine nucleoside N-ribohydrolase